MSWTQGIQERKDFPEKFRVWADAQSDEGVAQCLVWDETDLGVFHVDYYDKEDGKFVESKTFWLNKESK